MILDHINWKMMGIGILIGIIAHFVVVPDRKVLISYPEPNKADAIIFRDSNGACFKFKATEVKCEDFEDKMNDFPLQN